MFWIVLSFLRQRNSTFLVDQCLLVASSLLHQRKLIYPKSSALHDLRYVITLTREHWLWLGYITGSSKIKDKYDWVFGDQCIDKWSLELALWTSDLLSLYNMYQCKQSSSVQVFFPFRTFVNAWFLVTNLWASSTEVICTWPVKLWLYLMMCIH